METNVSKSLMVRWRHQIGGRIARGAEWSPRPFAALGYLINGRAAKDLIEIGRLVFVVVYDDPIRPDKVALRVAGYSATCEPHGVKLGGREGGVFYKDLSLAPGKATGLRINSTRSELLELALRMERGIHEVIRFGRRFRMRPRLPKLWAAFGPSDAENLHGEGPEFENMRTKFGFVGPELFKKFERKHLGQILYPLDWVSDQLKMSLGIYVELKGFPKCQLFCARKLPDDLCGFVGACEFDFFDSTQRDFWTIRASSAQQSPALCEA